jgi:hypothetical protein
VDNVDNPCSRRSDREFLSTGPVDDPVRNSGLLWTSRGPHSLSTDRPQVRPQLFPKLSTVPCGSVVRPSATVSTGRPWVTHRLEAVVHRLSTGLSTEFDPSLWITSPRNPKTFFRSPTQTARTWTKTLCTGFSTGPCRTTCPELRRGPGQTPRELRCGQGNRPRMPWKPGETVRVRHGRCGSATRRTYLSPGCQHPHKPVDNSVWAVPGEPRRLWTSAEPSHGGAREVRGPGDGSEAGDKERSRHVDEWTR